MHETTASLPPIVRQQLGPRRVGSLAPAATKHAPLLMDLDHVKTQRHLAKVLLTEPTAIRRWELGKVGRTLGIFRFCFDIIAIGGRDPFHIVVGGGGRID